MIKAAQAKMAKQGLRSASKVLPQGVESNSLLCLLA